MPCADLFLQDRIDEALDLLARVDAASVAGDLGTQLQMDYLTAYAAFFDLDNDLSAAAATAEARLAGPLNVRPPFCLALLAGG